MERVICEVMMIIVWFQQSGYRTFKDYYLKEVYQHLRDEFPNLVSYTRFVELMPSALVPQLGALNLRTHARSSYRDDAARRPGCLI